MKKVDTAAEYIAGFPKDIQRLLKQMRATIRKAAPRAIEKIAYGMPGYALEGPLVYFAAFKNHIGFYPTPKGMKDFQKEIAKFESSKGAIRFPLDAKLPLAFVTKMTKHRVKQNLAKVK